MENHKKTDLWGKAVVGIYILMGIVFLPILFCVFFLDAQIDYWEDLRLAVLLPNIVLFGIALLGLAAVCVLGWKLRKTELTKKVNRRTDIVLIVLFALMFAVNVWMVREIAFKLPWDIMVVTSHARYVAEGNLLGNMPYFSIYTNNIPIVYFLKKLYGNEFIWMLVNCILISLGGFFGCLTIKKLTKRLIPTILYFLIYAGLLGLSPWKMAPYTDVYGLVFPIMAVYFYLCYRESEKTAFKFLFMALTLVSTAAGSLMKPTAYIVLIAIAGLEMIRFVQEYRKARKYVLFEIILILGLFAVKDVYVNHMIKDLGLDVNEELKASWQHYLHMGQNEETTGAYSSDDTTIFGEFQESRRQRNEVSLERALARIKEKGFSGNLAFAVKKMTMVFNDGTFGWESEVWIYDYYPADLAWNNRVTDFLRKIFWPNMPYTGQYSTFCQFIWIFCLVGMSGFCFLSKERRKEYVVFAVIFLGIFFYQLLFEARARYLIMFLPVLMVMSVCGMWQYAERITGRVRRKTADDFEETEREQI